MCNLVFCFLLLFIKNYNVDDDEYLLFNLFVSICKSENISDFDAILNKIEKNLKVKTKQNVEKELILLKENIKILKLLSKSNLDLYFKYTNEFNMFFEISATRKVLKEDCVRICSVYDRISELTNSSFLIQSFFFTRKIDFCLVPVHGSGREKA